MSRRLAPLLASSAVAGAALLAWAGPLAAAPAWTPAHEVSGPVAAAGEPGAHLFGPPPVDGHTATSVVSVWESGEVIHAAERTAALGAWTPAKEISLTGASELASARNVAVRQRDLGDATVVESAIRLNGTWAAAGTLSRSGADATEPAVAGIARTDMYVAGWLSADGGNAVVQGSVGWWAGFSAGWIEPATLSDPSADASEVRVAGRGAGGIAVWRSQEGGESRIRASLYSITAGTWSPAVAVSPLGQVASEPRVATTTDGLTALVWVAGTGSAATIQTASLPADSTEWSEPAAISGPGAAAPALAVAQGAVAAWQRAAGSDQVVEAAIRPGDTGAWSAPERLSPEGRDAEAPAVAAGPASFYAAWRSPGDGGTAVLAATRPSGAGPWAEAQEIAPAGDAVEGLRLDEGNGEAFALWRRAAGPVQGAAYDALGPDYTDLKLPIYAYPTGTLGSGNPPVGRSAPGAVTSDKLAPGLMVYAAAPADPPAPSTTVIAPPTQDGTGRVKLTAVQLRINQRIAQAAIRRAGELELRLMRELDQSAFRDRTITAAKLHPSLGG